MYYQSDNTSVRTTKSLHINDVKVYEVRGEQQTNITTGTLDVCYSPEFDRFLLRINSFKYVLEYTLPIMATLIPKNAFRSYILPGPNGYYVLKFKSQPTPQTLTNFETILRSYSQLSYQAGQETELGNQLEGIANTPISNVKSPKSQQQKTDAYTKAGSAFASSGEFLKQKMLKAANYLGKTIQDTKVQGTNETTIKTLQELKNGDYPNNVFVDFPRYEFEGLIGVSNQIGKSLGGNPMHPLTFQCQSQMQSQPQPQMQGQMQGQAQIQPQKVGGWEGFKKTTTESAKSFWQGMDEAANIISNAWAQKRVKQTPQNMQFQAVDQNKQQIPNTQNQNIQNQPPIYQAQVNPQSQYTTYQSTSLMNQNPMQTIPQNEPVKITTETTYQQKVEPVQPVQQAGMQSTTVGHMNMYPRLETIDPVSAFVPNTRQTGQTQSNMPQGHVQTDYMNYTQTG